MFFISEGEVGAKRDRFRGGPRREKKRQKPTMCNKIKKKRTEKLMEGKGTEELTCRRRSRSSLGVRGGVGEAMTEGNPKPFYTEGRIPEI